MVKPTTIPAGGLWEAVSPAGGPGQQLVEGMDRKSPNNFFLYMKYTKTVIVRMNIR